MVILPFWIAEGARELDERSCPGRASRLRLKSGLPGGRDRSGGAYPAEFYDPGQDTGS
jgi:hypothetical protein